jgi:glycosidase
MTFNFHHLKVDYPGGEKDPRAAGTVALKTLFRHWQQGMHNRAWNALFWCNHDQPRIVALWRRRRVPGAGGENAGDGAARHAGHPISISERSA